MTRSDMSPSIQEVKAKHEQRLMALAGVVSVGIGLGKDNKPAIIVGLDHTRAETQAKLPQKLDGYTVEANVTGPYKAH